MAMDPEILKSLFLKGKENYESAVRWSFIIVVACLLFHIITFSQFISLEKELAAVKTEKSQLDKLNLALSETKTRLENLEAYIADSIKRLTSGMLVDLKEDFTALDRAIANLRTRTTAQFASTSADLLPEEQPRPNMALQMQVQAARPPVKEFELSDDIKARIRNTTDEGELRTIVFPVIQTQIINERFDELNANWQKQNLPDIQKRISEARELLGKNSQRFPENKPLWERVVTDLQNIERLARDVKFQTPGDADWWNSVSAKQTRLVEIQRTVESEFQRQFSNMTAVAKLSREMQASLENQKRLQTELETKMKKIEADFEQQKAALADLSKPFGLVTFDINTLIAKFPLMLGIALAAVTIWPAFRLREMAGPFYLLTGRSGPSISLDWLTGRIPTSTLFPMGQKGKLQPGDSEKTGPASSSNLVQMIFPGLIYWVWIGVCAVQLHGWRNISHPELFLVTLAGLCAVAIGQLYKYAVSREIVKMSRRGLEAEVA
jgi:hypothetical protein